ncbi:MAG: MazG family protein, partial [Acaryochloridaceae cyanobacterium RU_4_10]|nr:MazG family protein [Acaryochloridaceae cyanobacterium RU_4_10]
MELRVISVSELLADSISLDRPVLVTHIEHLDHLQTLTDWLEPKALRSHPITFISSQTGHSFTHSVSDISAIAGKSLPLQAYIPPQLTTQAIALQSLIDVVAQLRNPNGGCPWDLEQTAETLIPYIIEEAYETVDAIRQGEQTAIADELGDLLLQVILQSQIASESQHFTLTEVAQGITQKLIRRHPHVFGDVQVNSIDEVHTNWDKIKAAEKG